MNHIKKMVTTIKNHVAQNKFGYCMTLVAIGAIALQQQNVKDFYKFLEEKDIDPIEFYSPEYWEELINS